MGGASANSDLMAVTARGGAGETGNLQGWQPPTRASSNKLRMGCASQDYMSRAVTSRGWGMACMNLAHSSSPLLKDTCTKCQTECTPRTFCMNVIPAPST